MFYAIHIGMPAGVASVILQSQAFFTILLAGILLKEPILKSQIIGLFVAGVGLYLISGNVAGISQIPIEALLLTLLASSFWGASNIIARHASAVAASRGRSLNMLSLVVWSSLVPPLPMLAGALLFDKPRTLMYALNNLNAISIFSIFYLSILATLIGYGIWSILLAKYPAGKVAPLSLLVPVIGLVTAQIVLKEYLSIVQWIGGVIIILGLLISNFGGFLRNLKIIGSKVLANRFWVDKSKIQK
nr:EamA family transporter [uncultured Aminipila sp.]